MLDDASVSNLALFWAWKQRYKHLVVGSESSSYQLLLYVLSQNLPGSRFEEKEKIFLMHALCMKQVKLQRPNCLVGGVSRSNSN